jgi:precorrin-6B methylase 2
VTDALVTDDAEIVRAITGQRLAAWAESAGTADAEAAARACSTIGEQVWADVDEILTWLADRALPVTVDEAPGPRQRHDIRLRVDTFDHADAVARALFERGFDRWDAWSGAAGRSFRRHGEQITVARTEGHTLALRLRWGAAPATGRARRLLRSLFRPTRGDWTMVTLPAPLWRLYSVVRPVRLVLERVGLRDRHAAGLGPFLSTPRSLIDPLFEVVGLGPNDVLLDVGCGDGRFAIAAARSVGCRALGADVDATLVERARCAADDAEVGHAVTFAHADARSLDLSDVTVAVMFLPMDVVAELVAPTLRRLPRGARLLVHEQTPLPGAIQPSPDSSYAVIAGDAVTVAHVWTRS